ncbi:MAG: hypothetical protein JXR96_08590 [Deltaproteobacteria bacterium]|nr:hypothetical protein [Deltaproteobacteria bacterium]
MKQLLIFFALSSSIALGACGPQALTLAETLQALDESALENQALTSSSGTVEISTHFTIGQAVEAAADELRDFIQSQLPCAEISVEGAKLTVEYGVHTGNCTFHGQTYSGSHSVEIVSAQQGEIEVHHEWDALRNARVEVSGTADVTWSSAESSRRVVHELNWIRLRDDKQATGSGDRTQTALPAGILEGIGIQGSRQWSSDTGDWNLDIDGVEVRWIDPVPQAGTYELSTPFDGKTATFRFERVDEDTIAVTVESGRRSFTFHVNKAGTVTEQ